MEQRLTKNEIHDEQSRNYYKKFHNDLAEEKIHEEKFRDGKERWQHERNTYWNEKQGQEKRLKRYVENIKNIDEKIKQETLRHEKQIQKIKEEQKRIEEILKLKRQEDERMKREQLKKEEDEKRKSEVLKLQKIEERMALERLKVKYDTGLRLTKESNEKNKKPAKQNETLTEDYYEIKGCSKQLETESVQQNTRQFGTGSEYKEDDQNVDNKKIDRYPDTSKLQEAEESEESTSDEQSKEYKISKQDDHTDEKLSCNKTNDQQDESENGTEHNVKHSKCKDEISKQNTEYTREANYNSKNLDVKEIDIPGMKSEYENDKSSTQTAILIENELELGNDVKEAAISQKHQIETAKNTEDAKPMKFMKQLHRKWETAVKHYDSRGIDINNKYSQEPAENRNDDSYTDNETSHSRSDDTSNHETINMWTERKTPNENTLNLKQNEYSTEMKQCTPAIIETDTESEEKHEDDDNQIMNTNKQTNEERNDNAEYEMKALMFNEQSNERPVKHESQENQINSDKRYKIIVGRTNDAYICRVTE